MVVQYCLELAGFAVLHLHGGQTWQLQPACTSAHPCRPSPQRSAGRTFARVGPWCQADLQVRRWRKYWRQPRAVARRRPRAVAREGACAVGAARRARGAGCRWARVGVTTATRAPGCGRRARWGLRRSLSRAQGLRLPRLCRLARSALCHLFLELPVHGVQSLSSARLDDSANGRLKSRSATL